VIDNSVVTMHDEVERESSTNADVTSTASIAEAPVNAEFEAFRERRLKEMSEELSKLQVVNKKDRFLTARKEFAAKKMAQVEERLRIEFEQIQKARRHRQRKTKRGMTHRRTSRGQPIMSSSIYSILDKLNAEQQ